MRPLLAVSRLLASAAALALTACATDHAEPTIQTQIVNVPAPVACDPKLGPAPIYPDTPEAIRAAPNIAARAQLYAAGRLMRLSRIAEVEAAVKACSAVPK